MKKFALGFILLLVLCSVLFSLPKINIAEAEPKTIVVPDDYPTISSAIGNAADGDTIFVKKGIYEGPINETLIIDKTISLIGEDAKDTKINLHPPLVPMNIFTYTYMGYSASIKIEANYVKISGFTIDTPGGGISTTGDVIQIMGNIVATGLSVSGSYATIAENILNGGIRLSGLYHNITKNTLNRIHCTGSYNNIAANKIVGSSVEGLVRLEGSFNTVYGNTIIADGWYGIKLRLNVSGNIIAKNNITGCVGIHLEWASNSIVCANRISDYAGIKLSMGHNNTFYANHLENNTIGIRLGYDQTDIARQFGPSAANNIVYHNNFIRNKQQGIDWNWLGTNHWDYDEEGNYWSDYNGTDMNGDGKGDEPYTLCEAVSFYAQSTRNTDHYPLMVPFDISSVTIELPKLPKFPDTTPPTISIVSPKNKTHTINHVSLTFNVSESTSWVGYSLDGQANVTITGNTTITGLPDGPHNLVIYATDTAGNTGASETTYFSKVTPPPDLNGEIFLITNWIFWGMIIIAVVGAALLVYFRKVKKTTEKTEIISEGVM